MWDFHQKKFIFMELLLVLWKKKFFLRKIFFGRLHYGEIFPFGDKINSGDCEYDSQNLRHGDDFVRFDTFSYLFIRLDVQIRMLVVQKGKRREQNVQKLSPCRKFWLSYSQSPN